MPASSHRSHEDPRELKLFYVDGVRHSAVVLAVDAKAAVKLAAGPSTGSKATPRVLYGYVGEWEAPEVHEITLPKGYSIVRKSRPIRMSARS